MNLYFLWDHQILSSWVLISVLIMIWTLKMNIRKERPHVFPWKHTPEVNAEGKCHTAVSGCWHHVEGLACLSSPCDLVPWFPTCERGWRVQSCYLLPSLGAVLPHDLLCQPYDPIVSLQITLVLGVGSPWSLGPSWQQLISFWPRCPSRSLLGSLLPPGFSLRRVCFIAPDS